MALQEYADSTIPLFEADQAQQIRTNLAPSETVTLTWVITPLVTGSGLPLRVTAKGGGLLAVAQRPVVVNEPGTPPPLSMGLVREPGTLGPGQPLTLTAYVLDGHLEPITGTEAILTATVSSTPTADYVETLTLAYCDSCGHYRQVLQLPAEAPVGAYWVDAVATHADHDPAQAVATFFVAPALTMTLEVTPAAVSQDAPMTVTARVYDRGAPVAGAGVEAVITTPGGWVTVPLVYDGAFYGRTLKPTDLGPNLGGGVQSGLWTVRATADSYGSEAVGDASVVVKHRVYLPLIWRGLP